MNAKTWNWKSSKGTDVSATYTFGTNGIESGSLTNRAGTYDVKVPAIVQNQAAIGFLLNGKVAYQVMPRNIYDQIMDTAKKSFKLSDKERIENEIYEANCRYQKALNISPQEAWKWLDKIAELKKELNEL
jgi:hypothetical protein